MLNNHHHEYPLPTRKILKYVDKEQMIKLSVAQLFHNEELDLRLNI